MGVLSRQEWDARSSHDDGDASDTEWRAVLLLWILLSWSVVIRVITPSTTSSYNSVYNQWLAKKRGTFVMIYDDIVVQWHIGHNLCSWCPAHTETAMMIYMKMKNILDCQQATMCLIENLYIFTKLRPIKCITRWQGNGLIPWIDETEIVRFTDVFQYWTSPF